MGERQRERDREGERERNKTKTKTKRDKVSILEGGAVILLRGPHDGRQAAQVGTPSCDRGLVNNA